MNLPHYTWLGATDAIRRSVLVAGVFVGVCGLLLVGCRDTTKSGDHSTGVSVTASPSRDSASTPVALAGGGGLDSLIDSLSAQYEEAVSGVAPRAQQLNQRSQAEIKKLMQWEYKVVEQRAVDDDGPHSAEELEAILSELGKEGWECFSVLPFQAGVRITCKRRPPSALAYFKYIPGL